MTIAAEPRVVPGTPAVVLAPMEGVTDAVLRAVAGEWNAFTFGVSEFLRVSQSVLPKHVVLRHVPELATAGVGPTGLPVQVQLLGGDPGRMAASARNAVAAGATAIDINFGCPAPTVNRHDGGATLLKYPCRLRDIVRAVRDAVPRSIPVSAKMRLGWETTDPVLENAAMAAEGGADWITVHARTRTQGYAPPVFWPRIGEVRKSVGVPVVANGDIWTLDDFRRCRDETGCEHFMLGRGALADPALAPRVAAELGLVPGADKKPTEWPRLLSRLVEWTGHYFPDAAPQRPLRRIKQWLSLAAKHAGFERFDEVKRLETVGELLLAIQRERPAGAGRSPETER